MKVERQLPVVLTDAELVAVSDEMVAARHKFDDIEAESKRVAKTYKERLAEQGGVVSRLCETLERKTEKRWVDCVKLIYEPTGNEIVIRLDTGEIVEREKLPAQKDLLAAPLYTPPPTDEPIIEDKPETSTNHLIRLLNLQTLLISTGCAIDFRYLYRLDADAIEDGEIWGRDFMRSKAMGENCPIPRPAWVDDALGIDPAQLDHQERCQGLVNLLVLVGVEIGLEAVMEWGDEERAEVIDWATKQHAVNQGYEVPDGVPEKPAVLTPAEGAADAEPDEEDGEII